MLSVLIINSEIYERYSKYAYFFNWFEDNRNIVVCSWNKSACEDEGLEAIVPQLMEIIKNEPMWNAYVIDAPFNSMKFIQNDFKQMTQYSINPYERANSADYRIESDNLLKLVYFLGGRGVEKLPYIEAFQFKAVRPNNIFLITPRIFEDLEMQKSFLLQEIHGEAPVYEDNPNMILSENSRSVMLYSSFWERYDYPPNCRFLVYNMPNQNNQSYDDAWFTLWLSVLSLSLNTFPSAELGPYKLYVVNTLIADDGVANFLNKFYTLLLDAKDAVDKEVDNEVKTIKLERSEIESDDLGNSTPIYVHFPEVNLDRLLASLSEFGMTKDRPREDEICWREQMISSKDAENKLFKAIDRGKSEAVSMLTNTFFVDLPLLKRRKISQYASEDMRERMNDLEIEMIQLNTAYRASRAEFDKSQKTADKQVLGHLKKRIRHKPAMALLIASGLVYFIGFVPYLLASVQRGIAGFLISFLISFLSCGLLVLCGVFSLKRLYSILKCKIHDYNGVMMNNIKSVTLGAEIQSRYLSDLLEYMEKYQLVTNAKIDRTHMERINMLSASSDRFQNAIDQCAALARLRHLHLSKLEGLLEESLSTDINVPIYLHEDVMGIKMSLNRTKNVLNVPFPFVNGMELKVEELYECEAYHRKPERETEEG